MGNQPHWDEHVELVFSVLAGFAIAESFDLLATANFEPAQVILTIAVFYIVLENWYYLHKELALFNIESGTEVILYLLSLITYSCLPFLYGARSSTIPNLQPANWMLLNLCLLCVVDTCRKFATVTRFLKSKHDIERGERKVIGAFTFYAFTGVFYSILLFMVFLSSISWNMLPQYKAIIVVSIWGIIRVVDMILIPRVAGLIEKILVSQPAE